MEKRDFETIVNASCHVSERNDNQIFSVCCNEARELKDVPYIYPGYILLILQRTFAARERVLTDNRLCRHPFVAAIEYYDYLFARWRHVGKVESLSVEIPVKLESRHAFNFCIIQCWN